MQNVIFMEKGDLMRALQEALTGGGPEKLLPKIQTAIAQEKLTFAEGALEALAQSVQSNRSVPWFKIDDLASFAAQELGREAFVRVGMAQEKPDFSQASVITAADVEKLFKNNGLAERFIENENRRTMRSMGLLTERDMIDVLDKSLERQKLTIDAKARKLAVKILCKGYVRPAMEEVEAFARALSLEALQRAAIENDPALHHIQPCDVFRVGGAFHQSMEETVRQVRAEMGKPPGLS